VTYKEAVNQLKNLLNRWEKVDEPVDFFEKDKEAIQVATELLEHTAEQQN